MTNTIMSARRLTLCSIGAIVLALALASLFAARTALAQDEYAAGEIAQETPSEETTAETSDDNSQEAAADSKTKKKTKAKAKKEPKFAQVDRVKLNMKRAKILNNGKVKFTATAVPTIKDKLIKKKDRTITWRVSNPKVASITQRGVVQGKTAGTAVVTARTPNGKKATAKVRVVIQKSAMAEAIPILTYHRIASDAAKNTIYRDTNLAVSASMFDSQMGWLKSNGYHTVSTAELRDWRVNGTFLPKKSVLITIDDGFYETYHIAYPILRKYRMKATSFVIGAYAPATTQPYNPADPVNRYMGRDVIKQVREEYPKLEFQSHTFNMHYRNSLGYGIATSAGYDEIAADFAKNEKYGFTAIAYPFGHTSDNLLECVRANKSIRIGFGYLMSWPATRTSPLYNMPRFKIMGDGSLYDFAAIARTAR